MGAGRDFAEAVPPRGPSWLPSDCGPAWKQASSRSGTQGPQQWSPREGHGDQGWVTPICGCQARGTLAQGSQRVQCPHRHGQEEMLGYQEAFETNSIKMGTGEAGEGQRSGGLLYLGIGPFWTPVPCRSRALGPSRAGTEPPARGHLKPAVPRICLKGGNRKAGLASSAPQKLPFPPFPFRGLKTAT